MIPIFFPTDERLHDDITKVTNLCYYAPIDRWRRQGWCVEAVFDFRTGSWPRAYRGNLTYTGQGETWQDRVQDLVDWLERNGGVG